MQHKLSFWQQLALPAPPPDTGETATCKTNHNYCTLVKMHRGRWIAYYHGLYNYTLLFLVPCNSIETSPKPETNKSRVPCIHSTLVQDKMSVSNKMHKCVHHVQQQNALLMCSCKAFVGLGCKNPFTSMSATMFASTHKVVTLFLLFRFWWNHPSGLKTISFDF